MAGRPGRLPRSRQIVVLSLCGMSGLTLASRVATPPSGTRGGRSPVSASYSTAPSEYRSLRSSTCCPASSSGAAYASVVSGRSPGTCGSAKLMAESKSPRWATRRWSSHTLAGATSRWMSPWSCIWESALASCQAELHDVLDRHGLSSFGALCEVIAQGAIGQVLGNEIVSTFCRTPVVKGHEAVVVPSLDKRLHFASGASGSA